MSFPTPRQFGGKIIRTPDLLKCTVPAVRNKHLVRQDARRRVVCIGARRKAGCERRKSHLPLKPRTNLFTVPISQTPRAWQPVQKPLSYSVLREIRHFRLVQYLAPYSILDALYNQSVRKTACTPRSCSGKCLQFCLRLFSLDSVHRRSRRISGRANRASLAMRANTSGTSLAGLGNSLEGSPGRHPWTLCQIGSARMHKPSAWWSSRTLIYPRNVPKKVKCVDAKRARSLSPTQLDF